MMTMTSSAVSERIRRHGPEIALAAMALVVFLGFLGSVDLWGKREQRAAAEAIDTVDHGRWLVARIQGRPRLEKPPLPRWSIATLMTLTGRRDEWLIRLPSAFSALGTVALVYLLGKRIGGRSVGLASALILTSTGFFVAELRQAGNDGPLTFLTTLALYAAWRRLHAEEKENAEFGPRRWNILFYGAMGLGFLCKGPIVVGLVAITLVPYLACVRNLRRGLAGLVDGWGSLLFLTLALSWPVPVMLSDPTALQIWKLEMGQKAGTAGLVHSRWRAPLAADWPSMTLPWVVVALMALALPFRRQRPDDSGRSGGWFPWWWGVGNLLMFCLWTGAKPNYYLPCIPGMAILAGHEWVRATRAAREGVGESLWFLRLHWTLSLVAALAAPIVVIAAGRPDLIGWAVVFSLLLAAGAWGSIWAWKRGADAGALAPLAMVVACAVLIVYGALAPVENDRRSHRALAIQLGQHIPGEIRTVMFFHELDEGLWFYLPGVSLLPVPGSQAAYNDAFTAAENLRHNRVEYDWRKRLEGQRESLLTWLREPDRESPYVLIRDRDYDLHAQALEGLVEPIYREQGVKRSGLVLMRAIDKGPITRVIKEGQELR